MESGEFEVHAEELHVLNDSSPVPFPVCTNIKYISYTGG